MRFLSPLGLRSSLLVLSFATVAASGCSEGTGSNEGSLAVLVAGLPTAVPAVVTVSGPGGFTRALTGSDTLEKLTPGTYTVTTSKVTVTGGTIYGAATASQDVSVSKGTVSSASVAYAVTTGSLRVQVTGLPGTMSPSVDVRGPSFFAAVITRDTTIGGLPPGEYTVTSNAILVDGTRYAGMPRVTTVNVAVAPAPTSVGVNYVLAPLNLRIAGAYITQSVQRLEGSVPLVQGRDGLLRVFVAADEANSVRPQVRVQLFLNGASVLDQTGMPVGSSVPLSPTPDVGTSSFNIEVPKSMIQPGLSMVVELDPANQVTEADETDNRLPATGNRSLDVRVTAPMRVLVVRLQESDAGTNIGNPGNLDTLLSQSMRMFPIASYDVALRAQPFTIPQPLQASGTAASDSWGAALSALRAARVADGSADGTRMWYGIGHVTYTSGVAGLGYIGYPAAIGWDHSGSSTVSAGSASSVMAHELGHNFNRVHAPCGNAGNPDPNYPTAYTNGVIGQSGYNIITKAIVSSSAADLMGYCNNIWISDYTYQGVLNYRANAGFSSQTAATAASAGAVQPTLLVWGRVSSTGEVTLEPAFELSTRPELPSRDGSHLVRGLAADGRELFAYSFEPETIADQPGADRHFAFAIPMSAAAKSDLASLVVTGRGGRQARANARAQSALASARATAVRMSAGRARVQWDASAAPMVMVRDVATGQVLTFARSGSVALGTTSTELELVVSDGVRSTSSRVRVPR